MRNKSPFRQDAHGQLSVPTASFSAEPSGIFSSGRPFKRHAALSRRREGSALTNHREERRSTPGFAITCSILPTAKYRPRPNLTGSNYTT